MLDKDAKPVQAHGCLGERHCLAPPIMPSRTATSTQAITAPQTSRFSHLCLRSCTFKKSSDTSPPKGPRSMVDSPRSNLIRRYTVRPRLGADARIGTWSAPSRYGARRIRQRYSRTLAASIQSGWNAAVAMIRASLTAWPPVLVPWRDDTGISASASVLDRSLKKCQEQ